MFNETLFWKLKRKFGEEKVREKKSMSWRPLGSTTDFFILSLSLSLSIYLSLFHTHTPKPSLMVSPSRSLFQLLKHLLIALSLFSSPCIQIVTSSPCHQSLTNLKYQVTDDVKNSWVVSWLWIGNARFIAESEKDLKLVRPPPESWISAFSGLFSLSKQTNQIQ